MSPLEIFLICYGICVITCMSILWYELKHAILLEPDDPRF